MFAASLLPLPSSIPPLSCHDAMIYNAYRSSRVLQVGHLLGLGDRHLDNILLHRGAAQLIHIDFSVVFDRCAAEHVIRPNSNIGCCGTKSSRANLARSRCVLAPLQPEAISSQSCVLPSHAAGACSSRYQRWSPSASHRPWWQPWVSQVRQLAGRFWTSSSVG